MKKYGFMLLICSLPVILASCGGDSPSQTEGSNTQADTSELLSSGDQSETSNSQQVSSDESVSKGSDSSAYSSEISSESIDYTIGWSQDVLDVMEPHLGGHAIPFIDLPGRILATWIESTSTYDYSSGTYIVEPAHLSILSTGGFDSALAGAAKMTYQKAGWAVEFDRSTLAMHAEEETLGIKVDFYGEYDANDKMTNPQIDVFYNEPFVIPDNGAWRNATLEVLASIGVESPHALPYVYMGTLAEEATLISGNNNTQLVEIRGAVEAWDTYKDDILEAARAAMPKSKKWTETRETIVSSSYYSSSYTGYGFKKSFSDGYTVKAVLYGRPETESYYSSNPATPFLRVSCTFNG